LNIVRLDKDKALGSTAGIYTKDITSQDNLIGFILTGTIQQNGSTYPTPSNLFTQVGTIKIKYNGKAIIEITAARLYALNFEKGIQRAISEGDGSGADNQYLPFSLPIFVAPTTNGFIFEKGYGIPLGNKPLTFELEFPADGNNIDNRVISLYMITTKNSVNRHIRLRQTTVSSPTANENNYVNVSYGSGWKLRGILLDQTTNYGDGLTTNAPTIKSITMLENEQPTKFDELLPYAYLFRKDTIDAVTNAHLSDQYIYVPTLFENGEPMNLSQLTKIQVECGDTNAFTLIFEYDVENSKLEQL